MVIERVYIYVYNKNAFSFVVYRRNSCRLALLPFGFISRLFLQHCRTSLFVINGCKTYAKHKQKNVVKSNLAKLYFALHAFSRVRFNTLAIKKERVTVIIFHCDLCLFLFKQLKFLVFYFLEFTE